MSDGAKIKLSRVNTYNAVMTDQPDFRGPVETICILKLDYIGDLVMAMPAVEALRNRFPSATLDLICGSWNRDVAQASRLFSKIHVVNYFKDNMSKDGKPPKVRLPSEITSKTYDLAIDLRVQEETRDFLSQINARWYAGTGQAVPDRTRSIVLPRQWSRDNRESDEECRYFPAAPTNLWQAGLFISQERMIRCTEYRKHNNLIAFGPVTLNAGSYRAIFSCVLVPKLITRRPIIVLSAFATERIMTERRIALGRAHAPISIDFSVAEDGTPVDVRLRIRRGRFERMDFSGMLLIKAPTDQRGLAGELTEGAEPAPFRSRLHMGEQLLLLVQLVAARLNGVSFPQFSEGPSGRDSRPSIAVAPFSNSAIRDWPVEHYHELLVEVSKSCDCEVVLIGSADQAVGLTKLKANLQASGVADVIVDAGMPMPDVIARLSRSSLVISNNSGMAHLAGALGRPVVAVYSASHAVDEWGAVGPNVWIVQAEIGCQRCSLDFARHCHNEHRCMRDLQPRTVAELIRDKVVWDGNGRARDHAN
jgi:ADP-heptose:LPS heptosyltransferase